MLESCLPGLVPAAIRASVLGVVSALCALHARATVAQEVPPTDRGTPGLNAILRVYYQRPLRGSFEMSYCSPDNGNICFNSTATTRTAGAERPGAGPML